VQPHTPILPNALYSEEALMEILGLGSEPLRRARRSGQLRYSRPSKSPLYLGQWVIDWLQAQSKCEGVPA
jgi:hypothetical protein